MTATPTLLPPPTRAYRCIESDNRVLHIYDGFEALPWTQDSVPENFISVPKSVKAQYGQLANIQLGAPHGPFKSVSLRVSRAVGVVTGKDRLLRDVTGLIVAQGLAYATWLHTPEGPCIQLSIHAPLTVSSSRLANDFLKEQVQTHCLHQLKAQVISLFENLVGFHAASTVLIEFLGDWDECTEAIRKSITSASTRYWQITRTAVAYAA
jgi:hypothetical protein